MHLWRSIMWLLASNRVRGEFWWAVLLGQQEGRLNRAALRWSFSVCCRLLVAQALQKSCSAAVYFLCCV